MVQIFWVELEFEALRQSDIDKRKKFHLSFLFLPVPFVLSLPFHVVAAFSSPKCALSVAPPNVSYEPRPNELEILSIFPVKKK